jgi:hypothetical protein
MRTVGAAASSRRSANRIGGACHRIRPHLPIETESRDRRTDLVAQVAFKFVRALAVRAFRGTATRRLSSASNPPASNHAPLDRAGCARSIDVGKSHDSSAVMTATSYRIDDPFVHGWTLARGGVML